jgi:hypothetical protein
VSNVEEVKLQVAASVEEANRAVLGIAQVADRVDEALTRLRLTAIGSAHPSVLTAVANLEQARARLDEAAALIRAATDAADTYRTIV